MKWFKWQYLKLKGKKLWLLTMNQHETNSMYDHMLMNELHLIKWEHIRNRDHQLLMVANIERKTFSLKVSLQILLIWKQINRIYYKSMRSSLFYIEIANGNKLQELPVCSKCIFLSKYNNTYYKSYSFNWSGIPMKK